LDLSSVKFDDRGLVPVIAQDAVTGEVLMLAYAIRNALKLAEERGELVLFSRSRQEIWHKGATSGNTMKVLALRLDCDGDTVLAMVEPAGPACHTGNRSCFYRNLLGELQGDPSFIGRLWKYLQKRRHDAPEESYTANLLARGRERVAQKIGEEGVETALAVATGNRAQTRYETADLVYHLLVGLLAADFPLNEIREELASRHKPE
jgi:phosphoribosyl-ATP pyrophosphohydrolase/phosphoribosyl-AMP cyclohydrolase